MTKTFRGNCDKYCAANKLRASSPDVQMQLKMYFFVPFLRPCMHHNYGGTSESHARKDCVWPIFWMQGSIQPALESEC